MSLSLSLHAYPTMFTTVFRYYNSWIELSDDPACSDSSSSITPSSKLSPSPSSQQHQQQNKPPVHPLLPKINPKNELDMFNDIEKFAPQMAGDSSEWSIQRSFDVAAIPEDSASDSDDDFGSVFGNSFL